MSHTAASTATTTVRPAGEMETLSFLISLWLGGFGTLGLMVLGFWNAIQKPVGAAYDYTCGCTVDVYDPAPVAIQIVIYATISLLVGCVLAMALGGVQYIRRHPAPSTN